MEALSKTKSKSSGHRGKATTRHTQQNEAQGNQASEAFSNYDNSSAWSAYQWSPEHNCWYAIRLNAKGKYEYYYSNAKQGQASTSDQSPGNYNTTTSLTTAGNISNQTTITAMDSITSALASTEISSSIYPAAGPSQDYTGYVTSQKSQISVYSPSSSGYPSQYYQQVGTNSLSNDSKDGSAGTYSGAKQTRGYGYAYENGGNTPQPELCGAEESNWLPCGRKCQWVPAGSISATILVHCIQSVTEFKHKVCRDHTYHDHFNLGSQARVILYIFRGTQGFLLVNHRSPLSTSQIKALGKQSKQYAKKHGFQDVAQLQHLEFGAAKWIIGEAPTETFGIEKQELVYGESYAGGVVCGECSIWTPYGGTCIRCHKRIPDPNVTRVHSDHLKLATDRMISQGIRVPDGQDIGELSIGMLIGLGLVVLAAGALGGRLA